jgi:hypothetical protein
MAANPDTAVEILTPTTVQLLQSAEIDQQITTAKKYPRSVEKFLRSSRSLATLNEQTARACNYALPRDGKMIEGPSARLAEIIASQWGNCRYGARVVAEDEGFVTAQGVFHDLEHNSFVTFEIKRRITNRNGQRFGADMVAVTSNAACSIALRNAVFKGVPKAIWEPVYLAARATVAGDVKTLSVRRSNMIQEFKKLRVTPEELYALVGVKGEADIGLDEMVTLGGVFTAIQDGDTTVDAVFKRAPEPKKPAEESDLNRELGITGDAPKTDSAPRAKGEPLPGFDEAKAVALLRGSKSQKALADNMAGVLALLNGAETPLPIEAAHSEMTEALAKS